MRGRKLAVVNLRRGACALGAAAAVTVAAAAGVAAFDDANTIHACANAKTGALRAVSSQKDCDLRIEKPLEWNVEGPRGPAGAGLVQNSSFHTDRVTIIAPETPGIIAPDKVMANTITLAEDGDLAGTATFTIINDGQGPARVRYYPLIDGHPHTHGGEEHFFVAEVPAGATEVETVSFACDGSRPGTYEVGLGVVVESGAVTIAQRGWQVAALPSV